MDAELKKHIKATASYEVNTICKPLFDNFGITVFVYSKIFNNGQYWTLTNRADWAEYFYCAKYINPDVQKFQFQSGYYLDLNVLKVPAVQINTAREAFNAEYWFNIVKTYNDYYEIFGFATSRGNSSILNTYVNNLDIFEHFILYFKDQASELIQMADNNAILLPSLKIIERSLELPSDDFEKKKDIFYAQTPIKKYFIKTERVETYLTKRQFDCVNMLAQGRGVKEISTHLSLSPKTVSSYIEDAKLKLNCYTKSQLLDVFASNRIKIK